MRLFIRLSIFSLLLFSAIQSSNSIPFDIGLQKRKPVFLSVKTNWVDSVFNSLTPEQRIAQLFMVDAYSVASKANLVEVAQLIKQYNIGGVIFFQGGPVVQARMTNFFQSIAQTPLMIGIDGEWGLAMRLDSTMKYPKQLTLGAANSEKLTYRMGHDIAKQCKRLGIHVNFAPVVDINNNPNNPVISMRSFGESLEIVKKQSLAYMRALQDEHILTSAKHFPGHGDTDADSHYSLPVVNHDIDRLQSVELVPFDFLINSGLAGVMVGHLQVPGLDTTKNVASSLSPRIVTNLLRDGLGFEGLIFTDAMNMQGVAKYFTPGEMSVKALQAGNDIVLMPKDIPACIAAVKAAVDSGLISQKLIDDRCLKLLKAKKWVGLDQYKPIDLNNLYNDLNTDEYQYTKELIMQKSLTVVKNENLIPLRRLDTLRIASVTIGSGNNNAFQQTLDLYAGVAHFTISKNALPLAFDSLLANLTPYNLVIVGVTNTDIRAARNFGITAQSIDFVNKLSKQQPVILSLFSNPYALKYYENSPGLKGLVMAYEDADEAYRIAVEAIFGGCEVHGKLPVSIASFAGSGVGEQINNTIRLEYTSPEALGVSSKQFNVIDSIANDAIVKGATPGCQVLVAKNGKVVYYKSFGKQTYEKQGIPVNNQTIYDLASITKVAATTLSLMKLTDEEKFNVDEELSTYLPSTRHTHVADLHLKDILSHRSGLPSWIPFYKQTIETQHPLTYKSGIFTTIPDSVHTLLVADSMYISPLYRKTILSEIYNVKIGDRKYVYSDLGMYLMRELIEEVTDTGLDEYVQATFYKKMGAYTLGYNPLTNFDRLRIAPTEDDKVFRNQVVHGYVHDPGAALLGGVSGHAGLFSNANDLAKIFQMLLNEGQYGGDRYLSAKTIKKFNTAYFEKQGIRTGLGFDKPEMNPAKNSPVSRCVSALSYGHTGFTGTMVWADPEHDLLYIFLSNRVYPDAENKKLSKMDVRTNIQDSIYHLFGICNPAFK